VATSFFDQVYEIVRRIPLGKVATYGQIAHLLGQPRAARTVGWALRALPSGSDVPWQRVINARGAISLGADSSGAALQRALLEGEGVVFNDRGHIDLQVYGWSGPDLAERAHILHLSPDA
jgi:methylated-DNA-protein-cysteine methyltransferase-like protein